MAKKSLAERDQALVWHPYTQMQNAPAPIPIVKGDLIKNPGIVEILPAYTLCRIQPIHCQF